jgi:hypothetical protein
MKARNKIINRTPFNITLNPGIYLKCVAFLQCCLSTMLMTFFEGLRLVSKVSSYFAICLFKEFTKVSSRSNAEPQPL